MYDVNKVNRRSLTKLKMHPCSLEDIKNLPEKIAFVIRKVICTLY